MKNTIGVSLLQLLLLCVIIISIRQIEALPWWSFLVPVFLSGILFSLRGRTKAGFSIGFLAGLIVWMGGSLLLEQVYHGDVLYRIGLVLGLPRMAVLLLTGVMGGLLTGLAFYAGKTMLLTSNKTSEPIKQKI